MTVQSSKTISESNVDSECAHLALKLGGSHLKNKMADTNCFFGKVIPLYPKINTGNLNLICLRLMVFAVMT